MPRRTLAIYLCALVLLCSCGSGSGSGVRDSSTTLPGAATEFARCGGTIVDPNTGQIDWAEYTRQANAWDLDTIDCRLGPRHSALVSGQDVDMRPTLQASSSTPCARGYLCRAGYQVGPSACTPMSGCFGSDSGQAMYVPSAATGDPGVDRVQVYAWEAGVHCYTPRALTGGNSHPDPLLIQPDWTTFLGAPISRPIAMTRVQGSWTNDAVMIFAGGIIATSGTPSTGSNGALFRFPPNKVPTNLALTSSNEFLLVTIWDTDLHVGQLAVLSARGPAPTSHTWPYHGLFNAGGFTELKLLGYVDLPFATPTSVAAASDGHWSSPSDTSNQSLSQLLFSQRNADGTRTCDPTLMASFGRTAGDWSLVAAQRGYALVASRWENKVTFVDLSPLFAYYRQMYFGSMDTCLDTARQFEFTASHPSAGAQPADDIWPYPFSQAPEQTPTIVATFDVPHPRAVLAGSRIDRWSKDSYRAYAASYDGNVHIFSPGNLIWTWWQSGEHYSEIGLAPHELATVMTCHSPTAMRFVAGGTGDDVQRYSAPPMGNGPVPLRTEASSAGMPIQLDGLNGAVAIVCRGDREVDYLAGWKTDTGVQGQAVYWRFQDSRLSDPVDIDIADRADIRSFADFDGRSVLTYRFGSLTSQDCRQPSYPVNAAGEFGGTYSLPGNVFALSTTNVN